MRDIQRHGTFIEGSELITALREGPRRRELRRDRVESAMLVAGLIGSAIVLAIQIW